MWKINLPNDDNSLDDLKSALTYKNSLVKYELTESEQSEIIYIYSKYDITQGVVDESFKGVNIRVESKQALYKAYDEVQEGRRLENLRSLLLSAANRCPFCGISEADELDHHLPRSKFELLAIYARNLVPICHKCNNKKRTITGENPEESFIHIYYEKTPENIQFFHANTSIIEDGIIVKFEIKKFSDISELLYKQLSFQIKRINLDKRLEKEINIFLSAFVVSLEEIYGENKNFEKVKQFLQSNIKYFNDSFGLNDWRTVLLISLLKCDQFCDGGFKNIIYKK